MKYLKTYESMLSLAADMYFSKYGDTFTSPNDPFRVEYCNVTFPDERTLTFKVIREDYMSETLNLRIDIIENRNGTFNHMQDFYLKVYGTNIQFDSLNEYRFVRKYLNSIDLLDTNFDSYIYSDTHNGCFDISTRIVKEPNYFGRNGLIGEYNYNVMRSIKDIIKLDNKWKTNIIDFIEHGLYKSYEILDDTDKDKVRPIDIQVEYFGKNVGVSELLYLYQILRGFKNKEILKKILQIDTQYIEIDLMLKILQEIV
jgi:hypothetical protein